MQLEQKLSLYARNKKNVLLTGKHGVGKTEIIKKAFTEQYGDRWAYFSAPTMDAWVDFIGVPKPVIRKDGSVVLDLIRPARFADDTIEALFFDEYNRAPAKVRNAVMELIQFKSINGRKFNNLKVIWAAINPSDEDDTYDVDDLDPAQEDRFQIKISLPYKLNRDFLINKHGLLATPFCDWWDSLIQENKDRISPRRLDEAIDIYNIGGDLKDCLPRESNISELIKSIKNISSVDEWSSILIKLNQDFDYTYHKDFFTNLSNLIKFEKQITLSLEKYVQYIPSDFIVTKLKTDPKSLWINSVLECVDIIPKDIKDEFGDSSNFSSYLKSVYNDDNVYGIDSNVSRTELDLSGKRVYVSSEFRASLPNIDNALSRIGCMVQKGITSTTAYALITDNLELGSFISSSIKSLFIDDFMKSYKNVYNKKDLTKMEILNGLSGNLSKMIPIAEVR